MTDALIEAVMKNDVELVKQMIEGGEDVNGADWGGWTALLCAAEKGYVERAKALLEANADVDKADMWGLNHLHVASLRGHVECVKVVRYRLGVDEKPSFFLVCQLLIAWNANVNAKTHIGESPFHHAAQEGELVCIEVRKLLLIFNVFLMIFFARRSFKLVQSWMCATTMAKPPFFMP